MNKNKSSVIDFDKLDYSDQKVLDELSNSLIDQYNNLVEEILENNNDLINRFSTLTSRSNYQNVLFDYVVIIRFIRLISKRRKISLIKTNNYLLYIFLKKELKDIKIEIKPHKYILEKLKYKFKPISDFVKILGKIILNIACSFFVNNNINFTNKKITLIDTFITVNNLNEKSIDRNYTNISTFLSERQKKSILFLPSFIGIYTPFKIYKIKKLSKLKLIFKHDFLKPIDYFIALKLIFTSKFNLDNYYINDLKIDYLLKKINSSNKFNTSTFDAISNYLFIKRLKKNNINIKLFISWFENQPIDKGYIFGLRCYYPEVKIKGYQGFIISYDYNFNVIPTPYEVENKLCVDEVLVMGKKLIPYFKNINVNVAPAFRFSFLKKFTKQYKNHSILLLLPVGFRKSENLIFNTIQILKKINRKIHLKIKPHPIFKINKMNHELTENITHEFVEGNLIDNLNNVSVVLGNSTSSMVEALVNFTPVIIIPNSSGITQNPIPKNFDKRLWKLSYNNNDTVKYINEFIDLNTKKYDLIKDISLKERNNFFLKPNKKNVESFLELNNKID